LRPLLLLLLGALIVTEIVALSPSSLEETRLSNTALEPSALVLDNEPTLVPGVPKGRIAEYSIEKFNYVSVQAGAKQWKIEAEKAFLYNPEKLSHSRKVKAFLYDPEGAVTLVTGDEARYFLNQRDLEIYGNVKTLFPDGFQLESEYLRYRPIDQHIQIPSKYLAHGSGKQGDDQDFHFISHGLDYFMKKSEINLLEKVRVTLEKHPPATLTSPATREKTDIDSDHCLINRLTQTAYFTMIPTRPLKSRFVHITQPTLFVRSRRADLHYGSDYSQVLNYLTAYEDVLIKETGNKKELRYATGGRADFDTKRDVIILKEFPQVYQNGDTVTGDIVIMHRDTDVIEIEHSNAFSSGTE